MIQYFVVAQDNALPYVGINSGIFNATPTSVALTAGEFPITGTINSYTIAVAGVAGGTIPVGSGTYLTLTGAGGLFSTINTIGLSGNLTAIIDPGATITETGANALNAINYNGCGSTPYTLIIKPATTATLTGTVASGALIKINGASNVTIDGSNSGGTDRSLTITNTNATSPAAIWIGSVTSSTGTTGNTVKNCNISTGSNAATSYGIAVSNATTIGIGGADNDNVTIQNNNITQCYHGIFASGTASISLGGLDNLNINNNIIGPAVSGVTNIGFSGINLASAINPSVTLNTVQNMSATVASSAGIVTAATVNGATISQNTILGLVSTTSPNYGILVNGVSGSTYSISRNTISDVRASGSNAIGIEATVTSTIERNNISNIINTSTSTFGAYGININGGNNQVVKNNFVSGVTGDMTGGSQGTGSG